MNGFALINAAGFASTEPGGFVARSPCDQCCKTTPDPCLGECSCVYAVESCLQLPVPCLVRENGPAAYICREDAIRLFGANFTDTFEHVFSLGEGGPCLRFGFPYQVRDAASVDPITIMDLSAVQAVHPRSGCQDPRCPPLSSFNLFVLGRNPCAPWSGPPVVMPLSVWEQEPGIPRCFYAHANHPQTGEQNCFRFTCSPANIVHLSDLPPDAVGASGRHPNCCECLCGGDIPRNVYTRLCPPEFREVQCCCPPLFSPAWAASTWSFVSRERALACFGSSSLPGLTTIDCNCSGTADGIDNPNCCHVISRSPDGSVFEFDQQPPLRGVGCPCPIYIPDWVCNTGEGVSSTMAVEHGCSSSRVRARVVYLNGQTNCDGPGGGALLGALSQSVDAAYSVTYPNAPCTGGCPPATSAFTLGPSGLFVPAAKSLWIPGQTAATWEAGCGGCGGVEAVEA